jgi:hypothetical protein
MPTDTSASAVTGGKTNECVKAVGVGVAVGVEVNVGVGVDVGVDVVVAVGEDVGVADGVVVPVGVGVGVGVAVDVAVAVAVGVGVGLAVVYSIVSTGGLVLSLVSNRFDVIPVDSSASTSQPKLLAGLSSHDCTFSTICAELHIYCPRPLTDWLALTLAEKSPPWVVQKMLS